MPPSPRYALEFDWRGRFRARAIEGADDAESICAVSVAVILTNVLHEGVGHGLTALATTYGVRTTVAWSSAFDSRLVEVGGTLVNLVAPLVFLAASARIKQCIDGAPLRPAHLRPAHRLCVRFVYRNRVLFFSS